MKTMSMFAVSRRCCWWMTAALAIVVGVVKAQDACSALRAGDVAVYLLNSDDPDQIIFYPLADIDADVEFLYVTDNAWTGTRLLDTEGTYQFTIPDDGIAAGESFGLGEGSPFSENWQPFGIGENETSSFELGTDGDAVFVYCLDADNVPNFLWGLSYNGPWTVAGFSDNVYGTSLSVLPPSLETLGNTAIPHADNCVYAGPLEGDKSDLQMHFMNATLYSCRDDRTSTPTSMPTRAPSTMAPTSSPTGAPTSTPTATPTTSRATGESWTMALALCASLLLLTLSPP